MAKALYGHLIGDRSSSALLSEIQILRRRVQDLEHELARVRAENDALAPQVTEDELVELSSLERPAPALT